MKYLIPSYGRPNRQRTAKWLHSLGVTRESITISTQTEEDYRDYKRSVGDIAQVTFRKANNCAGNRNTLLSTLNENDIAMFLDDDIISIQRYDRAKTGYGKLVNLDPKGLEDFCYEAESLLVKGFAAVGLQRTTNAVNIHRQSAKKITRNCWQSGAALFVRKIHGVSFDERFDCLDDVEFTLKLISLGYDVAKLNSYATNKPQDTTEKGGCFEVYENGGRKKAIGTLCSMYSPLIRPNKNMTAVVMKRL